MNKLSRNLAVFSLFGLAWSGAQGACTCGDLKVLQNRLNEVDAALHAYDHELQIITVQQQTTGTEIKTNATTRAKLQGKVQESINSVGAGGTTGEGAGVTNRCKVVMKNNPPCLEPSYRAHEEVHQRHCEADYQRGNVTWKILSGDAGDRHEALGTLLADYAREEMEGYQTERRMLASEHERLTKDCKPKMAYSSRPLSSQPPPSQPGDAQPPAAQPAKDDGLAGQVNDAVNTLRNLKGLFGK